MDHKHSLRERRSLRFSLEIFGGKNQTPPEEHAAQGEREEKITAAPTAEELDRRKNSFRAEIERQKVDVPPTMSPTAWVQQWEQWYAGFRSTYNGILEAETGDERNAHLSRVLRHYETLLAEAVRNRVASKVRTIDKDRPPATFKEAEERVENMLRTQPEFSQTYQWLESLLSHHMQRYPQDKYPDAHWERFRSNILTPASRALLKVWNGDPAGNAEWQKAVSDLPQAMHSQFSGISLLAERLDQRPDTTVQNNIGGNLFRPELFRNLDFETAQLRVVQMTHPEALRVLFAFLDAKTENERRELAKRYLLVEAQHNQLLEDVARLFHRESKKFYRDFRLADDRRNLKQYDDELRRYVRMHGISIA